MLVAAPIVVVVQVDEGVAPAALDGGKVEGAHPAAVHNLRQHAGLVSRPLLTAAGLRMSSRCTRHPSPHNAQDSMHITLSSCWFMHALLRCAPVASRPMHALLSPSDGCSQCLSFCWQELSRAAECRRSMRGLAAMVYWVWVPTVMARSCSTPPHQQCVHTLCFAPGEWPAEPLAAAIWVLSAWIRHNAGLYAS